MRNISFILLICILSSCSPYLTKLQWTNKDAVLLKNDAFEAYMYLNRFREQPEQHMNSIGIKDPRVTNQPQLLWNEKLAKVAELKAIDMANRNYFSHQTPEGYGINRMIRMNGYKLEKWLKGEKRTNNFESIGAGVVTGKGMIDLLIIDEGVPSLGHRRHLLGMSKFDASLKDIGIGMAYHPQSKYRYYCVVIIAK